MLKWSPERIADYLISIVGWDLDRRNLELAVIAQVNVEHAVNGLRRQMEIAVDVNHVKWNEVREFVARLERVLAAIRSVGHDHPREAAELAWEFLKLIRDVAEVVQGEDELPNFFDEVLAAADELAVKAGVAALDRAKRLIDAIVIGVGYAMGEPAVEKVKGLELDDAQRADAVAYIRDQAKVVSEYYRKGLDDLARQLTDQPPRDRCP